MDGDTIEVLHEGKAERIRLYGIDCPEGHQDFSQKAKQFTSSMVFGEMVDVKKMDTDRYGRTVGLVSVAGKSLNEELLKSGMAWFFNAKIKTLSNTPISAIPNSRHACKCDVTDH